MGKIQRFGARYLAGRQQRKAHDTSRTKVSLSWQGPVDAVTGGPDEQDSCDQHYQVTVKRGDGLPLSEMELRSILTNLSWSIDGEDTLIDLERL